MQRAIVSVVDRSTYEDLERLYHLRTIAAIIIQSAVRGFLVRRRLARYRRCVTVAADTIVGAIRSSGGASAVGVRIRTLRHVRLAIHISLFRKAALASAATTIQQFVRARASQHVVGGIVQSISPHQYLRILTLAHCGRQARPSHPPSHSRPPFLPFGVRHSHHASAPAARHEKNPPPPPATHRISVPSASSKLRKPARGGRNAGPQVPHAVTTHPTAPGAVDAPVGATAPQRAPISPSGACAVYLPPGGLQGPQLQHAVAGAQSGVVGTAAHPLAHSGEGLSPGSIAPTLARERRMWGGVGGSDDGGSGSHASGSGSEFEACGRSDSDGSGDGGGGRSGQGDGRGGGGEGGGRAPSGFPVQIYRTRVEGGDVGGDEIGDESGGSSGAASPSVGQTLVSAFEGGWSCLPSMIVVPGNALPPSPIVSPTASVVVGDAAEGEGGEEGEDGEEQGGGEAEDRECDEGDVEEPVDDGECVYERGEEGLDDEDLDVGLVGGVAAYGVDGDDSAGSGGARVGAGIGLPLRVRQWTFKPQGVAGGVGGVEGGVGGGVRVSQTVPQTPPHTPQKVEVDGARKTGGEPHSIPLAPASHLQPTPPKGTPPRGPHTDPSRWRPQASPGLNATTRSPSPAAVAAVLHILRRRPLELLGAKLAGLLHSPESTAKRSVSAGIDAERNTFSDRFRPSWRRCRRDRGADGGNDGEVDEEVVRAGATSLRKAVRARKRAAVEDVDGGDEGVVEGKRTVRGARKRPSSSLRSGGARVRSRSGRSASDKVREIAPSGAKGDTRPSSARPCGVQQPSADDGIGAGSGASQGEGGGGERRHSARRDDGPVREGRVPLRKIPSEGLDGATRVGRRRGRDYSLASSRSVTPPHSTSPPPSHGGRPRRPSAVVEGQHRTHSATTTSSPSGPSAPRRRRMSGSVGARGRAQSSRRKLSRTRRRLRLHTAVRAARRRCAAELPTGAPFQPVGVDAGDEDSGHDSERGGSNDDEGCSSDTDGPRVARGGPRGGGVFAGQARRASAEAVSVRVGAFRHTRSTATPPRFSYRSLTGGRELGGGGADSGGAQGRQRPTASHGRDVTVCGKGGGRCAGAGRFDCRTVTAKPSGRGAHLDGSSPRNASGGVDRAAGERKVEKVDIERLCKFTQARATAVEAAHAAHVKRKGATASTADGHTGGAAAATASAAAATFAGRGTLPTGAGGVGATSRSRLPHTRPRPHHRAPPPHPDPFNSLFLEAACAGRAAGWAPRRGSAVGLLSTKVGATTATTTTLRGGPRASLGAGSTYVGTRGDGGGGVGVFDGVAVHSNASVQLPGMLPTN